ncbi:MAG: right-handed parallel beta-helix repeat-containing protein [Kiritimatiellae bacterium]|nr:right-handed parallel beta-helix repeat-containing protein [Kiritimatiellia bacterium]
MRKPPVVVVLFAVLVTPAAAAVLYVPGTYPTIQQTLDAASPGDTILVAPGTYTENLAWPSTDGIRLIGVAGWAGTTIDGTGNGRVVVLGRGLTRATVLKGFTVTGGRMNTPTNLGCGILVQDSSPTIRGNLIAGNVGDGISWSHGGGIGVFGRAGPLIERNIISKNILRHGLWNHGAGIYVDGTASPDIVANQIVQNENRGGQWCFGGGLYVGSYVSPTVVVGNVIAGNLCTGGGWSYGGGIHVA